MALENPDADKTSPEERKRTLMICIFIILAILTVIVVRRYSFNSQDHNRAPAKKADQKTGVR